jgi:hypothetical protein
MITSTKSNSKSVILRKNLVSLKFKRNLPLLLTLVALLFTLTVTLGNLRQNRNQVFLGGTRKNDYLNQI